MVDVNNSTLTIINAAIRELRSIEFGTDVTQLSKVAAAVQGETFDVGRGATFSPSNGVSIAVENDSICVHVYGAMTFKDRTDNAALVRVWYSLARGMITWATCRASAWDGRKWADMPEGARTRVAQAVTAAITETVGLATATWQALATERIAGERAAKLRGHLDSAVRELGYLADALGLEPSSVSVGKLSTDPEFVRGLGL